MTLRRLAILCAAAALLPALAACGHKSKGEPPAPLTSFDQTLKVRKLWSAKVGGKSERLRLGLKPATDGAHIFAGAYDGQVASLDAMTGRKQWSVKTGLPLSAGPGFGEGVLAFGTRDGELVTLDATTGETRWRVPVGSEVLASPAIGSDVIALRSVDGRLHGFSIKDGSSLWSIEQNLPSLTLRGNTAPRVAGTTVVSGFDNGKVGAYNIKTGEAVWEVAIANPTGRNELDRLVDVSAGLSIVGNDVYVVSYHGRVVGIDLTTGIVLWQQDMSSYAGLGTDVSNVYVTNDVDAVIALDRRGGTQVWRQEALRLRDVTAPTRYENAIVVGDYQGYLHWLDPTDGHFIAREHATGERIGAAPMVVGENVYVQGDDSAVAAYTTVQKDAAAEKAAAAQKGTAVQKNAG